MLQRVLEPESMDCPSDAMAYDSMDHAAVNAAFVDDLLAARTGLVDAPGPIDVLDLGTGTAQIPVLLATRCPAVRILAVDLAPGMLDLARSRIEIEMLTDRIRLDRLDAKALPRPLEPFDVVLSNSLVHHIAEPLAMLAEAAQALADDGTLMIRDLLRPASESDLQRLVTAYAGHEAPEAAELFAASLRAALTLDEVRQLVAALGFDPATAAATSDRHWTWLMQAPPNGRLPKE